MAARALSRHAGSDILDPCTHIHLGIVGDLCDAFMLYLVTSTVHDNL